jgi:uncharacterized integral membrane protein
MSEPTQPGYPPPGPQYPHGANQPSGPAPGSPGGPPQPQPAHQTPAKEKRPFPVGQVLGGILFILLVIFIVENSHSVPIRIIAGPVVHPPVWVAILIAAVLGALIAALLRYRRRVGARRKALVREHKAEDR